MSAERLREIGIRRVRSFTFEHQVGEGGTAKVYLEKGRCDRPIAVKISHIIDPERIQRSRFYIENESWILAGLSPHPNIISFEGAARTKLGPALAVKYLEGEDLHDYLFRKRGIPYRPALLLFRGLASAVAHIHEQGLVHADLKPGNVRVTKEGLILLDFAFARPKGKRLPVEITDPENPLLIGTPGYLSPGRIIFRRAPVNEDDWLALGLILYEMLAGKHAINFDKGFPSSQGIKQAYQELHKNISLLPIPEPGKNLIRKLIGLSRLGTYSADAEILRDIDQALGDPKIA
ncbi:MAG: serine/threonine-protein kinase [Candidatus Margulisiibacteriota bacterium]